MVVGTVVAVGTVVVVGSVGAVLVGRVAEGSVAVTSSVVERLRVGPVRVASRSPLPQPATTPAVKSTKAETALRRCP